MTAPRLDANLLAYLQAWRQYLEQLASSATMSVGAPPSAQWPVAAVPPMPVAPPGLTMPAVPPTPPALAAPPAYSPAPPMDYTQQLLATLQAWRQYLEQATPAQSALPSTPTAAQETVPPPVEGPHIAAPTRPAAPPPAAPARRTGSAYTSEIPSATTGHAAPPPRSLYSSATTPHPGGTGATTTWWDGGRPPADAPKPQPIPLAPPNPWGSQMKVPPELEPQAPRNPEGSAAPQLPAAPRDQLVAPSFDRRSR
jgi:hypothetical protein